MINRSPQAVLVLSYGDGPSTIVADGSESFARQGTLRKWRIDFGDGTPITGTGFPPAVIPYIYDVTAERVTATLYVEDNKGRMSLAQQFIELESPVPVNQPPIAALDVQSGQFDTDLWQFSTFGTGDPGGAIAQTTIIWGDGSANYSVAGPPTDLVPHQWPVGPDSYTITMTVVDSGGLAQTQTLTIDVDVVTIPPIAALSFVSGAFTGALVTVSTTGTSFPGGTAATYTMNWGDGTIVGPIAGAPPANLTHTYATPNTFTATLTVVDSFGLTDSSAMPILIQNTLPGTPPTATLTLLSGEFLGDGFVFGINGADPDLGAITWVLEYGDGTSVSGTGADLPTTRTRVYIALGSYVATFRVTDIEGLVTTKTVPLIVADGDPDPIPENQSPIASIVFVSGQFTTDTFRVSLAGTQDIDGSFANWQIAWGDGQTSGATGAPPATANHQYAIAGSYTVVLTVTDDGTPAKQGTASLPITVQAPPAANQPPTASLARNAGTYLTDTFSFALTGTDPDGTVVGWTLSYGDGSAIVTGTTLPATRTRVYSATGTYVVTFVVTDNGGLTRTAQLTAVVLPVPPATGDHARFNSLTALPTCFLSRSLRNQADLNAMVNEGRGGTSTAYTYNYAGDPYPAKQDAAKLTFPTTQASISIGQQLIAKVVQTNGTFLLTWDQWYGPEWMKTIYGGNVDTVTVPQYIHKEFQLGFATGGGDGKGKITYEIQQGYRLGTTGNVGPFSHRLYTALPNGVTGSNGAPYGPSTVPNLSIFILHSTWVRYVQEVRLNQDASAFTDWVAFTGVPLAPGTYHMMSTWILTPTTGPSRIIYRMPLHRYAPSAPSVIRDGLSAMWFEHNTSSPIGALTAPCIMYARDLTIQKNYTLPVVPENDALIFQRP